MNATPSIASTAARPDVGVGSRRAASGGAPDKVREMTQQFEAVFVRHLLNQAQKPSFGGGAIAATSSRGVYQDMMVERWADQISRSGDLGVARSLELQIRQPSQMPASTPHAAPAGGKPLP